MHAGDQFVRRSNFKGWRPQFYGSRLTYRTIGLLGMGAVGQAFARRISGFEMRVLYSDPNPLPESLELRLMVERVTQEELLRESDVVLPLLPLTPETFHLFNDATLARMKKGALLINVARGSLVDEEAVARALTSGQLGGYAADVFEMEDWARPDRPRTIPRALLTDTEHTLFTPHLGSAIDEVRLEIEQTAAMSILQALKGEEPIGAVNRPEKGAHA